MDASIIANLKQLYRKLVIHRLLDFMEDHENQGEGSRSYEEAN